MARRAAAATYAPTLEDAYEARPPPGCNGLEEQDDPRAKLQTFFLIVSMYAMCMLVMIPCWNCATFVNSWVYAQLLGLHVPLKYLIVLIGLVFVFFIILYLLIRTARTEAQTYQTMVMTMSAFLTLLGVVFMLFGHELAETSRSVVKNIEHNCEFYINTEKLYVESNVLYSIRLRPDCLSKVSIEDCEGYDNSYEGRVLKSLENDFKCTTFCNNPKLPSKNAPRSLFSTANYKAKCQSVLIRSMRFYVEDVGVQAYYQGGMLVLVSVIIGFLKLFSFCPMHPPRKLDPRNYGATSRSVDARGVLT